MFSKNRMSLLYLAGAAALIMGFSVASGANAATSGDWPTYLSNKSRMGFNGCGKADYTFNCPWSPAAVD
jgi:hypothetical protein